MLVLTGRVINALSAFEQMRLLTAHPQSAEEAAEVVRRVANSALQITAVDPSLSIQRVFVTFPPRLEIETAIVDGNNPNVPISDLTRALERYSLSVLSPGDPQTLRIYQRGIVPLNIDSYYIAKNERHVACARYELPFDAARVGSRITVAYRPMAFIAFRACDENAAVLDSEWIKGNQPG